MTSCGLCIYIGHRKHVNQCKIEKFAIKFKFRVTNYELRMSSRWHARKMCVENSSRDKITSCSRTLLARHAPDSTRALICTRPFSALIQPFGYLCVSRRTFLLHITFMVKYKISSNNAPRSFVPSKIERWNGNQKRKIYS